MKNSSIALFVGLHSSLSARIAIVSPCACVVHVDYLLPTRHATVRRREGRKEEGMGRRGERDVGCICFLISFARFYTDVRALFRR